MRFLIPITLAAAVAMAAELPLAGTWAGDKPVLPADATVVLAMLNRDGTCCGGPLAAMAGLANLRSALAGRPGIALVEIDVTAGGTPAQAVEAAKANRLDGLPLLVDGDRATAKALQVEIEMTMTYVVRKADGSQDVVFSPNQVKKKLGL